MFGWLRGGARRDGALPRMRKPASASPQTLIRSKSCSASLGMILVRVGLCGARCR